METAEVRMPRVGRKKNKPEPTEQAPKQRPGYPVFARLDDAIGAALDAYLKAQRPRPTITAVLETALEDFLRSKGFWPPPPPPAPES